jgi:hypothetical protein
MPCEGKCKNFWNPPFLRQHRIVVEEGVAGAFFVLDLGEKGEGEADGVSGRLALPALASLRSSNHFPA